MSINYGLPEQTSIAGHRPRRMTYQSYERENKDQGKHDQAQRASKHVTDNVLI
jgi:hypothetical protein